MARNTTLTIVAIVALFGLAPLAFADAYGFDLQNGKEAYGTTCVACHGENGSGIMPGIPNFTKSASPLGKPDEELFANITNGFQSPGSPFAMPARGANPDLSDQDILDLIYYMREAF